MIQQILTMSDKNVKFKPNETSVLMEYVQMRVGMDKITKEDFSRLNTMLICNRGHEILTMFNSSKKSLGDRLYD